MESRKNSQTIKLPLNNGSIKALCYASLFAYPLTRKEMDQWQIADTNTVSEKTKQHVTQRKEYYVLPHAFSDRAKAKKISEQKLQKAMFYARIFSLLPSILFIGVSGSLARYNAKAYDDIDFFIITKANTLWTTRLLLTLCADFLGIRRKPTSKHTKDKLCLNMFIDTQELTMPLNKQNLYTAHEVRLLLPLINKEKTYETFLSQNAWTKQFLPKQKIPKAPQTNRQTYSNIFEQPLRNLQKKFMRERTQEITTEHQIFFHPKDYSAQILKTYKKILRGGSPS